MPKKSAPRWADATRAIHGGEPKHGLNGPVTAPIVRTSNFTFADTAEMKRWAEGKSKAYIYTRYGNPTLAVAEAKIADLENKNPYFDLLGLLAGSRRISTRTLFCEYHAPNPRDREP